MKIQYTKHAEATLTERKIAKETVEELINTPQQVIKGKGNKEIVQGIFKHADEEFLLRVVYVEVKGLTKVITAYWTSKIDKYWEGSR
jgi:hypothetical protein